MNDRNDCDEVVQSNVLISQPRQRMFLLTAIENILNGSFYFSLLLVLLLLLERKKYTNVLHAWSYKPAITHCKSTKIEAKQNKNIFKAWTSVFVGISSGQNMKKNTCNLIWVQCLKEKQKSNKGAFASSSGLTEKCKRKWSMKRSI